MLQAPIPPAQDPVELFGLYVQLTGLLAGPLLALLPILGWELWIKPRRERRQLARTLHREVTNNLQVLQSAVELDARLAKDPLPEGVRCSTIAFEARAQQVAEFTPQLASAVILLYNGFARLNHLADSHETRLADIVSGTAEISYDQSGYLRRKADTVRQQRDASILAAARVISDLKTVARE